jgi:hypothetical protein
MLAEFVQKAVELGADGLEIDYQDGEERVCAMRGAMGVGIGSLPTGSKECEQLLSEVAALKKSGRVEIGGVIYRATVSELDSFGETAFRIKFTKLRG